MDLMRELDPPCQRGCGRTFDECDEEEDGDQCAGSQLVQRLERELAEAQAEIDRIRAVALDTHHQQELRWEDEHAKLRARVAELEAQRDKIFAEAPDQFAEVLYDAAHENCDENGCTGGGMPGWRQFVDGDLMPILREICETS